MNEINELYLAIQPYFAQPIILNDLILLPLSLQTPFTGRPLETVSTTQGTFFRSPTPEDLHSTTQIGT